MKRLAGVVATILIACSAAACSGGPASPSTSPEPSAATTFEGSSAAVCQAFTSLIRAVGNPDAGTPSVLSKSLDVAVAAGDVATADRQAGLIRQELERGREQSRVAAGWAPLQPTAVAMEHLLVAFEAQIDARRAAAAHAPGALDPQAAFEGAGGSAAWSALGMELGRMPVPAGASPEPCRAFSGTL